MSLGNGYDYSKADDKDVGISVTEDLSDNFVVAHLTRIDNHDLTSLTSFRLGLVAWISRVRCPPQRRNQLPRPRNETCFQGITNELCQD